MKCIFGILNNRQFWKIKHLATHGDLLTDQLRHHGHLTYCIRLRAGHPIHLLKEFDLLMNFLY